MTPEGIKKIQEQVGEFFDKGDSMSAQQALAMMWALNVAGLDVKICTAKNAKGRTLAKKVNAMRDQIMATEKTQRAKAA